jgi:hypothetical protein
MARFIYVTTTSACTIIGARGVLSIVTAAIDQRFGRQLRHGANPGLTSFLNVLALGRRQPLYIVFST